MSGNLTAHLTRPLHPQAANSSTHCIFENANKVLVTLIHDGLAYFLQIILILFHLPPILDLFFCEMEMEVIYVSNAKELARLVLSVFISEEDGWMGALQ